MLMEDHIEEMKASMIKGYTTTTSSAVMNSNKGNSNYAGTSQQMQQSRRPLLIQQLTPSQVEERCAKGLCFCCDEKYHSGHVCKSKMFALLLVNEEQEQMETILRKRCNYFLLKFLK